jgi:hypothetical protein
MEGVLMISSDVQTTAIINAGMKILREHLGVIETEIFIASIGSNKFDYTKWRENLWEDTTPSELFGRAQKTEEKYSIPDGVKII